MDRRLNLSGNVINHVNIVYTICECLEFARFIINTFLLDMVFLLQRIWNRTDLEDLTTVLNYFLDNMSLTWISSSSIIPYSLTYIVAILNEEKLEAWYCFDDRIKYKTGLSWL